MTSPSIDHLVYVCAELDEGVRHIEALLGVEPSQGGRHEGRGTHNALVGLGAQAYLEIVAPDPGQREPDQPRWFGLDRPGPSRLATWCARSDRLDETVALAAELGVDLGAVVGGSRRRPDGSELRWRFTDPPAERLDGLVPFFIDWGESAHPGGALPALCSLERMSAAHPEPERVRSVLDALGIDLPVAEAPRMRLVAELRTPNGLVVLD